MEGLLSKGIPGLVYSHSKTGRARADFKGLVSNIDGALHFM